MDWKQYESKKGQTVDFKKLEKVVMPSAEEIVDENGDIISEAKAEVKESYIALSTKKWSSETGEELPSQEVEYTLSELESKKSEYEANKLECENQIAGLTLAIEDFKKL